MAAGGISEANDVLRNVETMLVTEDAGFAQHWQFGPSLPMPISDAASASTLDQRILFVIGGTVNNEAGRSLFKFSCSDLENLQCSWTKIDYELKAPSTNGLAIMIPSIPMVTRGYQDAKHCAKGK